MVAEGFALDSKELINALEQLPVGVWLTDAQGRIVWTNHTLCSQLGVEPTQVLGRKPDALPTLRACDLSRGESHVSIASPGQGAPRMLQCFTRQLTSPGAALRSIGCLVELPYREDASRRRLSRAEPPRLDPRTGVLGHAALMRELESQVSRSRRYHNPLSVVVLHIHGRVDGGQMPAYTPDAAQAAVGRVLNDKLRWVDIAGQWDERTFLLVLPETSGEAAQRLVDKLAGEMLELPADGSEESPVGFAVSFGIAQWRQGDDAARLVDRAESALGADGQGPLDAVGGR